MKLNTHLNKINPSLIEWVCFLLVLGWFIYQQVYFAINISPETFPDEPHHIFVSNMWRDAKLFQVLDTPQSYGYGQVSRQPYLYHLILGTLIQIFPFSTNDMLFYRMTSVVMSSLGLFFSWLFYRSTISSSPGRIFAIYFQTCILMYVFISAAVSYDVLTNTIAFAAFWYLIRTSHSFTLRELLVLASIIMAGCLTKIAMLPLVLIFIAAIFVMHGRRLLTSPFWTVGWNFFAKNRITTGIFIVLFALNLKFYGTNLIQYHSVVPNCEDILSKKICDHHFAQSRRSKQLLAENADKERLSLWEYLPNYFLEAENGIFNIKSHRAIVPLSKNEYSAHRNILLASALGCLVQLTFFRRRFYSKRFLTIFVLTAAYVATVIAVNYGDYKTYGHLGLGLQGRYWFPVLTGAIFLIAAPIFENIKKPLQVLLLVAGILATKKMGIHIFEKKVNKTWFMNPN